MDSWHLLRLLFSPQSRRGKKLLAIWDLKSLPWSVGDSLVFIETVNAVRIERNHDAFDLCIIYDDGFPAGNRGRGAPGNHLTSENARDYILDLLPMFSGAEGLGSLFLFTSRDEFDRFLRNNLSMYDLFPSLYGLLSEKYNLAGGGVMGELVDFKKKRGWVPSLRVPGRSLAWAYDFYRKTLPDGALPVALSLKVSIHDQRRNADPAAWLPFLDQCKKEYPEVVFVALGYREERMKGIEDRTNVVFASDYGTNVMEQMALIATSCLYMVVNSGLAAFGLFGPVPYLMYNMHPSQMFFHVPFTSDTRIIHDNRRLMTPEVLFDDFRQLYGRIDRGGWFSTALRKGKPQDAFSAHL